MKELVKLAFHLRFKELFFLPTANGLIRFFRYCFVGAISFTVDSVIAAFLTWLLAANPIASAAGAVAGFVAGLTVLFSLSKRFVFTEKSRTHARTGEFVSYAIVTLIGLGIGHLLMMIATEWLWNFGRFSAGIIVAAVVLIYHYLALKFVLYRQGI